MAGDQAEPVRLEEDSETGDLFLVYGTEQGLRIDIRYEGETLWMTQAQIAQLFGRDISTISRHIANVHEEGELDEATSLQKMQTSMGRPTTLYSLDMVISVGYRVSSAQATLFRRWATGILVQFARKGFVVDTRRLKEPGNAGRIAELREVIRDLRSEEANLYHELRRICSMCQDYDGSAAAAREFFQRMQAKLVYAVTSHTPAEIVVERADCEAPDMASRQYPQAECHRLEELSDRHGNQGTEPSDVDPARHLRRPARYRQAGPDGGGAPASRPSIAESRPHGSTRRRLCRYGPSKGAGRGAIRGVRSPQKAGAQARG